MRNDYIYILELKINELINKQIRIILEWVWGYEQIKETHRVHLPAF